MIHVQEPGLLSTIQDKGRFGYQRFGVIASGVMDQFAYRLANALVGNAEDEAVLEVTLTGPTLLFEKRARIAICGGDFSATCNGAAVPLWKPFTVEEGDLLHMKFSKIGCRAVIAVAGGIPVEPVMGSRSTYVRAKLGGFKGRPIEKEDRLPMEPWTGVQEEPGWSVSRKWVEDLYNPPAIRITEGVQAAFFSEKERKKLVETPYKLSSQSDRMGFRLEGAVLEQAEQRELLSEAVAFGTIQVPTDGQPIILLADRQTLGGYPKIAQVASVDLPALAQKKPGEFIQFEWITQEESERLMLQQERMMRCAIRSINQQLNRGENDVHN